MFKLFTLVFLISLIIHFGNTAQRDVTVPPIVEELPLILIEAEGDLRLPTDVRMKIKKKWLREEKKIQFNWFGFEKQLFYCPAETIKQNEKIEKANKNYNRKPNRLGDNIEQDCLFQKTRIKKGTTSTRFPECLTPPQPRIMREIRKKQTSETNGNDKNTSNDNELVTCGPSDAGQSLIYGYQICDEYKGFNKLEYILRFTNYPFKVKSIEMYQICYNSQEKEILFTSHKIKASLLSLNHLMENEIRKKPSEEMRTNKLAHVEIDFEKMKLDFKKIESSNKSPKFKIQLLAPLMDFPFKTWKRPVFHYVNASLINEELQSCWNAIHDTIRRNAIQSHRRFTIYTRAFKHFETPPENGSDISKIHPPSIWVKLVCFLNNFGKKVAVAIFANNYRSNLVGNIISQEYKCEKNLCWRIINSKFGSVARDILCCEVTQEILQLFGFNLKFEGVLDIEGLIENEEETSNQESAVSPPLHVQEIVLRNSQYI